MTQDEFNILTIKADHFHWYDYGARLYDPQLGRWMTVDPLAEISKKLSPYVYCFDNPLKYGDDTGEYPTKKIAEGSRIGSPFGPRYDANEKKWKSHEGQDFPTKSGSNIHAAASGTITKVKTEENGYGNYVEITHSNGMITRYGHLLSLKGIKHGQTVENGQIFACVGSTGKSNGPHLHLEIIINGKQVNPLFIEDLQQLIDDELCGLFTTPPPGNINNPIQLNEAVVSSESPYNLNERLDELLWQNVRPNTLLNTGRYNRPARVADENFSDTFLKWYYSDPKKDNKKVN